LTLEPIFKKKKTVPLISTVAAARLALLL
jgi:hypothetical protein